jgi:putative CocE/NonD family hydrolase
VFQDGAGKYGSEGDYVMTRALSGPANPTKVDHATDCYDTIDWLVKNVPESNGRVGTLGGSYEGYTTVMSTVHPHPALKAAVPFAPMVDGWMGDDWFHQGAFRQFGALEYAYDQEAARKGDYKWWVGEYDGYDTYLRAGSAGALAKVRGLDQVGFWRALAEHTSYDWWWQAQAVDKVLAKEPLTVPTMIVSGLFDQEDIYGGPALFKALAPKDPRGEKLHLVLGPWNHGQGRREGRSLGALQFEGDTAGWFRRSVMQPFLDHYLKDAPQPDTPRVLVYETGVDQWHKYDNWPQVCSDGCAKKSRSLYLLPDGKLGFDAPTASAAKYDEYIRPQEAVFIARPTLPTGAENSAGANGSSTISYAASRTDVLVYQTEPLRSRRLAGECSRCSRRPARTDADCRRSSTSGPRSAGAPTLALSQMLSADISAGAIGPISEAAGAHPEQGFAIPHPAAEREPHVPAGASHHGADPVQLVSAVRPQSADVRAEHHVRETGKLCEGDPACLACARHGQRDRVPGARVRACQSSPRLSNIWMS